jgi:hypothetical protein
VPAAVQLHLPADGTDADELFTSFAVWAEANGTALHPAQEEALILAKPTGSGKSLVAAGAI